jgi:hypothetical protein
MRWFDFGEEAHGVLAIGQFATGVVAFGQFAYGVVAVGQFAFGLFAVGQVAVGGVAFGLVGAGMYGTVAMLGVGGRGLGFVLPLLPALGRRAPPSDRVTMATVREKGPGGWVHLRLEPRPDGRIARTKGTSGCARCAWTRGCAARPSPSRPATRGPSCGSRRTGSSPSGWSGSTRPGGGSPGGGSCGARSSPPSRSSARWCGGRW